MKMGSIENNKRLKDSLLWHLQQDAYTQFGPDAWAAKGVPFYLTSNPLLAKQFSAVILAYISDCVACNSFLNRKEPIYIFDLGAGSGRLGYLMLKSLLPKIHSLFPGVKICYIMTDMVENTISNWKKHRYLKEFIESGHLDFSYYHHEWREPLQLIISGKTLQKENMVNPVVLVCTYYFDTLPQDSFRTRGGVLEEGRISIAVPGADVKVASQKLNPEWIMNLKTQFRYFPISNPEDYYADRPDFNLLLQDYVKRFDEAQFLFPIGGLESLRYFENLSKERLLLLAGDQGVSTDAQVREWGEPKIFLHSTFSMAVSYHLLAKYFELRGGFGMLTSFPNPKFVVISGILGGGKENYPHTNLSFRQEIDDFEPVDYWQLTNFTEDELGKMSIAQLLRFVKLGNWDPINFHTYIPYLLPKLSLASQEEKSFLKETIVRVWEKFFPVSVEEGLFVMNLGVLLFELGNVEEALFFFKEARNIAGEDIHILTNLAKCYRQLNEEEQAKKIFQKVISLKAKTNLQVKSRE